MYIIHFECPPFGFYFGFADLNFIIPKGVFIFKNHMFNIFSTPRLTRGILYTKKHLCVLHKYFFIKWCFYF